MKRKASTKARITPEHFEELKTQLIINWDQTVIKYVPVSCWTHEKKAQNVEIAGIDDKHQITTVLAGTLAGGYPPTQLIYLGTTPACLQKVEFPDDWQITYTHNHWANEDTVMSYIHSQCTTYTQYIRKELKLSESQPALTILTTFRDK